MIVYDDRQSVKEPMFQSIGLSLANIHCRLLSKLFPIKSRKSFTVLSIVSHFLLFCEILGVNYFIFVFLLKNEEFHFMWFDSLLQFSFAAYIFTIIFTLKYYLHWVDDEETETSEKEDPNKKELSP